MVTMAGTEGAFVDVLNGLIERDHDAAEAYKAVIERLEREDHRARFRAFTVEHERQIQRLAAAILEMQGTPGTGSSRDRLLRTGRLEVADLSGATDKAILEAMRANEEQVATAYQSAEADGGGTEHGREVVADGLAEARRRLDWFEAALG